MVDRKRAHRARMPETSWSYSCVCDLEGDHEMGPLSAEQLKGYAGEMLKLDDVPWAFRNWLDEYWTCGRPPAPALEKRFHCTECGGNFVLTGGTLLEHTIAGRICPGSNTVPHVARPFVTTSHEMIQDPPRRLTRPKWSETTEDVRQAADALTSFTRDAYRVQVAQREEDLKEMLRRALKLVEENPRNEPMRAEISRPAVERMLAEDLAAISTLTSSPDGRAQIAAALFDAGWRPTIDRLVR